MEKNKIWEVLGRNGNPRVGVRTEHKGHITSLFAKSSPSQTNICSTKISLGFALDAYI